MGRVGEVAHRIAPEIAARIAPELRRIAPSSRAPSHLRELAAVALLVLRAHLRLGEEAAEDVVGDVALEARDDGDPHARRRRHEGRRRVVLRRKRHLERGGVRRVAGRRREVGGEAAARVGGGGGGHRLGGGGVDPRRLRAAQPVVLDRTRERRQHQQEGGDWDDGGAREAGARAGGADAPRREEDDEAVEQVDGERALALDAELLHPVGLDRLELDQRAEHLGERARSGARRAAGVEREAQHEDDRDEAEEDQAHREREPQPHRVRQLADVEDEADRRELGEQRELHRRHVRVPRRRLLPPPQHAEAPDAERRRERLRDRLAELGEVALLRLDPRRERVFGNVEDGVGQHRQHVDAEQQLRLARPPRVAHRRRLRRVVVPPPAVLLVVAAVGKRRRRREALQLRLVARLLRVRLGGGEARQRGVPAAVAAAARRRQRHALAVVAGLGARADAQLHRAGCEQTVSNSAQRVIA